MSTPYRGQRSLDRGRWRGKDQPIACWHDRTASKDYLATEKGGEQVGSLVFRYFSSCTIL